MQLKSLCEIIFNKIKNLQYDETYFYFLDDYDEKNNWALVFGYVDGDDEVSGKVAYQPIHSMMQEYDIDWDMPYDKDSGDVWDTEIHIGDIGDIEWLLEQWCEIRKEYDV